MNQRFVSPALDFACVYLSPVLFSVFYILAMVTLFFSTNSLSKATEVLSVANGTLSYGVGSLIKTLVERPRPEALAAARVIPEARIIGLWHTSTFSFPSTTAMLAFGLSFPILLERRRTGMVLIALSYLMGFAVIYTGFHFPLDVAAGTFFSLVLALFTNLFKHRLVESFSLRQHAKSEQAEGR